ncbi:MAG: MBL fold metallo-hydrolase [Flavobacteriales bacterium]|nr:MBL fold metallo-hydrolase [Flavobacteriales bacterium]
MNIEFLGTGTSQGVPVIGCGCAVCASADVKDIRLRSSALVTMNGVRMVIDTGPDFRQQMLRSSVDHIDAVLYTHEHADHIMGLDDIRAINFKHGMDMPLYATEHVEKAIRGVFHYAFTEKKYPGVPMVHFQQIDDRPFSVNGQVVIPIHALHGSMAVTGFRFGDLTYLTDVKTISNEELEKVRGSRVVVLNALRIKDHHSHLNLQDALALIEELAPERAYLTHISHLLGKHGNVSALLPKGVELAFDGLKIEL